MGVNSSSLVEDCFMVGSKTAPTFVLVHGAWADGASWHKVIDALETRCKGHSRSDSANEHFGRRPSLGSLPGKDRGAGRAGCTCLCRRGHLWDDKRAR